MSGEDLLHKMDQVKTHWSDGSWLSTVHRTDTHQFETVYFSNRKDRSEWRHDRVIASNPDDAVRNHDILREIVNDMNRHDHIFRRAHEVDTHPRHKRFADPDGGHPRPDRVRAPWASETGSWYFDKLGHTHPPKHPGREELQTTTPVTYWPGKEEPAQRVVYIDADTTVPAEVARAAFGTPPSPGILRESQTNLTARNKQNTHSQDKSTGLSR